jgi:hypothetical protein
VRGTERRSDFHVHARSRTLTRQVGGMVVDVAVDRELTAASTWIQSPFVAMMSTLMTERGLGAGTVTETGPGAEGLDCVTCLCDGRVVAASVCRCCRETGVSRLCSWQQQRLMLVVAVSKAVSPGALVLALVRPVSPSPSSCRPYRAAAAPATCDRSRAMLKRAEKRQIVVAAAVVDTWTGAECLERHP